MRKKVITVSLILGFAFDIFFWKKVPGISFSIFITLAAVSAYVLLSAGKFKASKKGHLLLIPISFFSVFSFIRQEPLSNFLNYSVTLVLLMIWMMTFQNGLWPQYSLADYIVNTLRLAGKTLGFPLLQPALIDIFGVRKDEKTHNSIKPILRGILLAAPIILVFAALLSEADPIFSQAVDNVLTFLNLENLGEYFLRGLLIFIIANLFLGAVIFAAGNSSKKKLIGIDKPLVAPFLGFTETSIILTSVLALFAVFVAIQFRYFFFGQDSVTQMGFTYSEYARRGFGELVAVSVFSLGLIMSLNTVTKRNARKQKKVFSALVTGLVFLVLVILWSAFQRLSLYEWAYGFSRLRTYSHVFMVWLGVLLIATALLEVFRQNRKFTLILILFVVAFSASINLLNVDAFITRQNIHLAMNGKPLDSEYLSILSNDAIPTLVRAYSSGEIPQSIRDGLSSTITLHEKKLAESDPDMQHWQSFHFSRWAAARAIRELE